MPSSTRELVVGGVLLVHGVAHVGPILALVWIAGHGPGSTGPWLAARTWLAPSLDGRIAAAFACTLWAVALVGFVAAALGFWGVLPIGGWRAIAAVAAIASGAGIIAFLGTWPLFNTAAAMAVNAGVLVALFVG